MCEYPAQDVREWLPTCGQCGSTNVDVMWEDHRILYGVSSPVYIDVRHPVNYCNDCRFCFYDWRAEEIRDETVKRYQAKGLTSTTSERTLSSVNA